MVDVLAVCAVCRVPCAVPCHATGSMPSAGGGEGAMGYVFGNDHLALASADGP